MDVCRFKDCDSQPFKYRIVRTKQNETVLVTFLLFILKYCHIPF